MAGGKFSSMNKKRPGAYINFEAQQDEISYIGDRGIMTMAMPLHWGQQDGLIEVSAEEFASNKALAKIGLTPNDIEANLIKLALQNCKTLKIYNTNKTGKKASAVINENLTVTAKYEGTFGNTIAIIIKPVDNVFIVETYADGYFVNSQKVSTIDELIPNDFVTFSGTGNLQETSSTLLENGEDGTEMQATEFKDKYFTALKATKFNTLAWTLTDSASQQAVIDFIKNMRDNEGKYVQAVLANATVDYEGIINVVNGVILNDDTTLSASDFVVWVASATAGAQITESLTGKVVENAVSIVNMLDNDQIIEGLNTGKFILSLNQNGTVKVEKDINSLHTFTAQKQYVFSKNRVIRELDEIGSSITNIWETVYLGKVSNNETGRTMFKSSIIAYLTELNTIGAIQDFDASNVIVEAGDDIDSVIASIAIKPVDSMEFLYLTVTIS